MRLQCEQTDCAKFQPNFSRRILDKIRKVYLTLKVGVPYLESQSERLTGSRLD